MIQTRNMQKNNNELLFEHKITRAVSCKVLLSNILLNKCKRFLCKLTNHSNVIFSKYITNTLHQMSPFIWWASHYSNLIKRYITKHLTPQIFWLINCRAACPICLLKTCHSIIVFNDTLTSLSPNLSINLQSNGSFTQQPNLELGIYGFKKSIKITI